ncbi:MAG: adenylyl-sulfate reductase subunit alpha [Rhodospirillales bacterium]|nr:adenylyl-sulfate reductase subunit alpha [Rhodospirillales bacterium]MCW8861699.1 adenylyl-sulfate reductase subunit alpha [Rhodospirillales bacterium]MCW8951483.1 adenylyl-sulfate reductase subunit alpha [Rhodospirillales bacterium]MCW8970462.1 adenylyl-sulfate reductase subunit alpha [Rhodospirillales bacterium]MCW9002969.1 adenylyl-sulfate reductase subunit alpha [Rhodospirillales bacterium]
MTEGTFGNPEIIDIETDILLVGGGMAACGAAFEAKRWASDDLKITLVDKAAMDRSGAVAMGLSAINTYLGDRKPEDYCRMVSADLMGITRDDLVFDVGRHVDDSVHLFEEWGLPIWKDKSTEGVPLAEGGKPVRSGRWQIMINGEGYKTIVAEAAKKALGIENIMERVFIVKYLLDENEKNRIAGAVGFSVREHKLYVFKANAILNVAGGCVNIFRPRSSGEGNGRTWYPVWNAGSTYAMAAEVGAELTMMENRFVPARFKDGYGPVGAWFLLFKSKATNGFGEDYVVKNADMLKDFAPYDQAAVVPTCLRNHAMLKEMKEGRGPILMDTPTAMAKLAETMTPQEIKHLEAEAWEDFLDMCIGQAGVWAGMNIRPEETPSELMPTEPYLLGSHSGCCGIWVSGPSDIAPPEWQWGYNRMTTVKGLFTAGDGVGASGHKFSSGSHAEGRIAGKEMVRFVRDNKDFKPVLHADIPAIAEEIYLPVRNYIEHKDKTTAEDVNPHYILPAMFQKRLQKYMDEYVAGTSTYYQTNAKLLEIGLQHLTWLKEDSKNLRAKDLHELMRAWENYHRLWAAEAHLRHIMFREETRYPGFFYRADFPDLNEAEWKCFVNSRHDPETGEWEMKKVPHIDLVEKHYVGQGH